MIVTAFQEAKGADIASATTITIPQDGNFHVVTGATTIAGIVTANWQGGVVQKLELPSGITITHNSGAPGAGAAAILMASGSSLTTTTTLVLFLVYDGTHWVGSVGDGGGSSALTAGTGITFVGGTAVTSNLSTGISGGQAAIGGTGASEALTLSSTTNGTKGKVIVGGTTVFFVDEQNVVVAVGIASPAAGVSAQFNKNVNDANAVFFSNANAGDSAYTTLRVGDVATDITQKFLGMTLTGTGWGAGAGGLNAQDGLLEHSPSAGQRFIINTRSDDGSNAIVFATSSSRTERYRLEYNGQLRFVEMAAPASPGAGFLREWADSTAHNKMFKSSGGVVNHGVQTKAATSHNFVTAIADDGTVSVAQPDASDLTGWPAATRLLVSTGATTPPGSDQFLTQDTANHILSASNCVQINGATAPSNVNLITGRANNGNRDRVQFFVFGGSLPGSTDNTGIEIIPANTTVPAASASGIWATERIETATYTDLTGAAVITEAASLYIDGAPTLVGVAGAKHALHVAAGNTRLDGGFQFTETSGPALLTVDTIPNLAPNAAVVIRASGTSKVSAIADYLVAQNVSKLFYYMSDTFGASISTGQWLLTSQSVLAVSGITGEYPTDIIARHATLNLYIHSSTLAAGSFDVSLTKNGTVVAATTVNVGVVTGALTSGVQSTGSSSSADIFGVFVKQHGGTSIVGAAIGMSVQLVLTT